MPLVPLAAAAVAEVPVATPHPVVIVMSKDMMQPPDGAGQPITAPPPLVPVIALPVTLRNIRSVAPLLNSVIPEHAALAVVSIGPATGAPKTPAVTGIRQIVGSPAFVPQTYMFPVPVPEL